MFEYDASQLQFVKDALPKQSAVWVKPSVEKVSLKDALSGGSTSSDGTPASNSFS